MMTDDNTKIYHAYEDDYLMTVMDLYLKLEKIIESEGGDLLVDFGLPDEGIGGTLSEIGTRDHQSYSEASRSYEQVEGSPRLVFFEVANGTPSHLR